MWAGLRGYGATSGTFFISGRTDSSCLQKGSSGEVLLIQQQVSRFRH